MKRAVFLTLLLAVLGGTPAFADAADDPAAAAGGFYAVYGGQHAQGIPDATGRLRFQAVLSPRLNKALADAASAQAQLGAAIKKNPKSAMPPMLEGDIFSSLFEGATSWKVGGCTQQGSSARCPVALTHDATPGERAQKPASWNDTLVLVATPQGWKVDDVIYDAGFALGNTGRLTDMLSMVIAANP